MGNEVLVGRGQRLIGLFVVEHDLMHGTSIISPWLDFRRVIEPALIYTFLHFADILDLQWSHL
jgi:hypothetical protein